MDWKSRKVLALRVSNSMDADSYVEALEEAVSHYAALCFQHRSGAQFTSDAFTNVL